MKHEHRIGQAIVTIALLLAFPFAGLTQGRKGRVFDARYDAVWSAAMDAAKEGFLPDPYFKQPGHLRFRAGSMQGYQFEVVVQDLGAGKTRVEVELRTRVYKVNRNALRNADRYLTIVSRKLQEHGQK